MFRESGPAKLVDATEAGPPDAEGNPTRKRKARPEYVVMLTPQALAAYDGALDAYVFTPDYYDDCWAGIGNYAPSETTVYLKFTTEAECRAKLAAFLKVEK